MRLGVRGAVVGAVIVLHLLGLWALQAGLLHRVVLWVVPVSSGSGVVTVSLVSVRMRLPPCWNCFRCS